MNKMRYFTFDITLYNGLAHVLESVLPEIFQFVKIFFSASGDLLCDVKFKNWVLGIVVHVLKSEEEETFHALFPLSQEIAEALDVSVMSIGAHVVEKIPEQFEFEGLVLDLVAAHLGQRHVF